MGTGTSKERKPKSERKASENVGRVRFSAECRPGSNVLSPDQSASSMLPLMSSSRRNVDSLAEKTNSSKSEDHFGDDEDCDVRALSRLWMTSPDRVLSSGGYPSFVSSSRSCLSIDLSMMQHQPKIPDIPPSETETTVMGVRPQSAKMLFLRELLNWDMVRPKTAPDILQSVPRNGESPGRNLPKPIEELVIRRESTSKISQSSQTECARSVKEFDESVKCKDAEVQCSSSDRYRTSANTESPIGQAKDRSKSKRSQDKPTSKGKMRLKKFRQLKPLSHQPKIKDRAKNDVQIYPNKDRDASFSTSCLNEQDTCNFESSSPTLENIILPAGKVKSRSKNLRDPKLANSPYLCAKRNKAKITIRPLYHGHRKMTSRQVSDVVNRLHTFKPGVGQHIDKYPIDTSMIHLKKLNQDTFDSFQEVASLWKSISPNMEMCHSSKTRVERGMRQQILQIYQSLSQANQVMREMQSALRTLTSRSIGYYSVDEKMLEMLRQQLSGYVELQTEVLHNCSNKQESSPSEHARGGLVVKHIRCQDRYVYHSRSCGPVVDQNLKDRHQKILTSDEFYSMVQRLSKPKSFREDKPPIDPNHTCVSNVSSKKQKRMFPQLTNGRPHNCSKAMLAAQLPSTTPSAQLEHIKQLTSGAAERAADSRRTKNEKQEEFGIVCSFLWSGY